MKFPCPYCEKPMEVVSYDESEHYCSLLCRHCMVGWVGTRESMKPRSTGLLGWLKEIFSS